jgi:hypothetical protein
VPANCAAFCIVDAVACKNNGAQLDLRLFNIYKVVEFYYIGWGPHWFRDLRFWRFLGLSFVDELVSFDWLDVRCLREIQIILSVNVRILDEKN